MRSNLPRILVLGVGNILLGDEGVGVHVVRELERSYAFPPNVELVDGGTAGLDLLPIIERADHLLVIDCVQTGCGPGSLFRFTPEDIPNQISHNTSAHHIGLIEALSLAQVTGKRPQTVIIGIQPEEIGKYNLELTPTIQRRMPEVVKLVLSELHKLGIVTSSIRET